MNTAIYINVPRFFILINVFETSTAFLMSIKKN